MLANSTSHFPAARQRTHVGVSGQALAKKLSSTPMTEENFDDGVVLSVKDGDFRLTDQPATAQSGEAVLPMRFGPLRRALKTIEEQQGWLLSHQPVIKKEGSESTRIDFINYGGFVFNNDGGYQSHSVNAW